MNVFATWLYLIGTPQRAKKLHGLLVKAPRAVVSFDGRRITEAAMCPTRILFGEHESHRLYADPAIRPALDAWDAGLISRKDVLSLCEYVEPALVRRGKQSPVRYHGPAYQECVVKPCKRAA